MCKYSWFVDCLSKIHLQYGTCKQVYPDVVISSKTVYSWTLAALGLLSAAINTRYKNFGYPYRGYVFKNKDKCNH